MAVYGEPKNLSTSEPDVRNASGDADDRPDSMISESVFDRYRMLYEESQDIIWFARPNGEFVDINRAAIEAYGYTREEFLSMNIRDLRHSLDIAEFPGQLDLANSTGIHFETLHVRKDGSSLPVDVKANGADFGGKRLIMAIVRDISDRKKTENSLRESEERRQLAQEAGQVGVWDWDIEADKTYWSETMWSFYDEKDRSVNPNEEFWSSHLHPSDRERVRLHIRQIVKSKKNQFREEFRVLQRNGSIRWIEAVATVSRDGNGRATRMYGVNVDVTSRKDTEERIKRSENQLRLVTNAVPALISYVDSSERYRFVNQQFTGWFAMEVEELVGKSVREVVGPAAYRELKPNIERALAGDECDFETILTYKTAGLKHVHVSFVPDVGVDGTVYGYYGLTHDLTEVQKSQDLLRSSEERMALMVESVTDYAIFSMDTKGIIDKWNSGAEIIFGYKRDEIVGKSSSVLFTREDVDRGIPAKEMSLARDSGRSLNDRWQLRHDRTRFYANGVMMPLYVGDTLTGYAKILSDLTEKERLSAELRQANDELELRVQVRTTELAESNLALVKEMEIREVAERERIELLERLITGQEFERRRIARDLHDHLGQQLTALRLKIASLKEISSHQNEIVVRVERLQEIAEQLDSEVSFLAWELRPTALDDLGLVDAIGAFVHEWSKHYGIEADFHSASLSKERLNHETETHLYRITQEALNNIVKHAAAKFVTVLLEKRDENVILIIEDDGIGFSPVAKSVSGNSRTGLGLIGMRERATLIGGDIEFESATGKGTTIYVRAPIGE